MILLLAGCTPTVTGRVESGGAPVAGAVVDAPACRAVTGADGTFRTVCERGWKKVQVTHPGYLPREVSWNVGSGEVVVEPIELVAIPVAPGVHVRVGEGFVALSPGPFQRSGSAAEGFVWCMGEGTPVEVPAGKVRLLDNHDRDWRVFRLDSEGCAYRLEPTPGGYFDWSGVRVEVERVEAYAPGRDWMTVELTPGEYVFADWFEGGFVEEGGSWRGSWVRAKPVAR